MTKPAVSKKTKISKQTLKKKNNRKQQLANARKNRIAALHRLKGKSKKKTVYPLKPKYLTPTNVIDYVLKGAHSALNCPHVLIGSSMMYDLLQSKVAVWSTHSIVRNQGLDKSDYAEDLYSKSGVKVDEINPKARSNIYPFLSTTADFIIIENGEKICVEVKSTRSLSKAKEVFSCKKHLIQLWTNMDILNVKRGRLVAYHLIEKNKKLVGATFLGQIDVEMTVSILRKLSTIIESSYVTFLDTYCRSFFGKPINLVEKNSIWEKIREHAQNQKDTRPLYVEAFSSNKLCEDITARTFSHQIFDKSLSSRSRPSDKLNMSFDVEKNTKELKTRATKFFKANASLIGENFSLINTFREKPSLNREVITPKAISDQLIAQKKHLRYRCLTKKTGKLLPLIDCEEIVKEKLPFDEETLDAVTTI